MKEFIETLKKKEQITLAIGFIEISLHIWENYVSENGIMYKDSVVGTNQNISLTLIQRVSKILKKINNPINRLLYKKHLKAIYTELLEPITALQDADLTIPSEVELVLYATYNLFQFSLGKTRNHEQELLSYVSINQSIDAITKTGLMSFEEVKTKLYKKF